MRTVVVKQDLSESHYAHAVAAGQMHVDIETSGLDWASDQIATCQVCVPGVGVEVIQFGNAVPKYLLKALEEASIRKIFHHAMFDLRFLVYRWRADVSNICCTKIMAKLLWPERDNRELSLKPLLAEHLGVVLDKGQQTSEWRKSELSWDQVEYAANDVVYLGDLYDSLDVKLGDCGLDELLKETFSYIPTRVLTDLRGCSDLFSY